MENISHSRPQQLLHKKPSCNNATHSSFYDDVFSAPTKFPSSLSPRLQDYAEIFNSRSSSSSIPVLNLPLNAYDHPQDYFFDVKTSSFDYSQVFGGFNASDFATSFHDLLRMSSVQEEEEEDHDDDEAWSPEEGDYLSKESEGSLKSEGFSNRDSCEYVIDGNDMKFNISYNKVGGRSSFEDLAQFQPLPEYTFVVDKASSLPKMDGDDDYVSMRLSDDGHFNIDLSREMVVERPLKKTMSNSVNGDAKSGMLFEDDVRTCRDYVRIGSFPNESFVTISDVSLKTRPSRVPPPSRPPPPALDVKKKYSTNLLPNVNTSAFDEGSVVDGSPPFFDVEVDANSSAAVSAAAIKEAMEKAQAKMKSAKELMDRKRDGFQSRTKSGFKEHRKDIEGNIGRIIDGFGSNGGIETEIVGERQYIKRTNRLVQHSLEGENYPNGLKREENHARESLSSQGSVKIDEASEWKEATEFFELVRTDKSKNIFDHVIDESMLAWSANVVDHGKKEQKENDKKGKLACGELEEYERKVNISKEVSASQENNGRLEAAVAVQRQKGLQKKAERSRETSRQKENEKKLMFDMQLAGTERKQMITDDLLVNENMEVLCEETKLEVKEAKRHKEKEPQAKKRSDEEKRLAREKKGTERRKREALEQLDNEKRLDTALEQANKERILVEEMMKQAEKEKMMKEAHEREENERILREALEREENERRLREAFEQEESERKLREAFEKQENERRRKETLEKEEKERRLRDALEKEENERRLRQKLEKEENERRLRQKLEKEEKERLKEKEEIERQLRQKLEKEENERRRRQKLEKEENERRQRLAAEKEENEKRQREAFEREENERRPKEALENKEKAFVLEESQEKRAEACKKEEIQVVHADDFGHVKAESIGKRSDKIEQENKPLRGAQVGTRAEEEPNEIHYQEDFEDTSLEALKPDTLEDSEDTEYGEWINIQGGLGSNQHEAAGANANSDVGKTPSYSCQHDFEHENASEISSEDGSENSAGEGGDNLPPRKFASQKSSALNQGKFYSHGSNEKGIKIEQAQVPQHHEDRKDNLSSTRMAKETIVSGKKVEATQAAAFETKASTLRPAQQVDASQGAERKMKNCNDTISVEDKEAERIKREKELEAERLRKMEEERDRERERVKDRMAVDIATLEARERANSDARERAERAAIERALTEARQRAMNDARERLEKACAEAREKSLSDKASVEARIRAERAAVERATAEARERAFEKAMAERAASEARERLERSVSDKFSTSSRNTGMRQNSLSSDLQDTQMQNSGSFTGSRYQYSSIYGGSYNTERSNGVEGESPQRRKARLERHQRTAERAAKALAEKNMRDLLAQREQAERNRIAETLDAEVRRWSSGKEGNLRALLSTLQYILGPDSGWHPIPLTEVITSAAVKKAYRKATLCVHPDKLQQRGASIHQKYICEKVFDLLKEAWNKFNSEER